MNIIIYNPNSFGGNYSYANRILMEYIRLGVTCKLVLPSNAAQTEPDNRDFILLPDVPKTQHKVLKKLYFVFRSILNPFILFFHLVFKSPSIVVFNDYDQLTAFIWVPFFHPLRFKHRFAVILHDPDRDAYLPFQWLSGLSMRCVMTLMDWALYHEVLPKKWYYNNGTHYFSVPHGLYDNVKTENKQLKTALMVLQGEFTLCTILGNIRKEKNYEAAIKALQQMQNLHLIIAGQAASSAYTMADLKVLAKTFEVAHKITWINKYLSDAELNSVLKHTDILLLNYASSFKSQSGILNVAAPFEPYLLVSKTESGLYDICKRFGLAEFIAPDCEEALEEKFLEWDKNKVTFQPNWSAYRAYASWEQNIKIALKHFETR